MNYLKKQLTITGILIITMIFLTFTFGVSASAQTNLEVFRAELSVPFDKTEGKLLAVGESLVFIDDDKPEFSFAIEKDNIADLQNDDEVLTVQTKRAVKDRSGGNWGRNGQTYGWGEDNKNAAGASALRRNEVTEET